jgi:hypothetical protein
VVILLLDGGPAESAARRLLPYGCALAVLLVLLVASRRHPGRVRPSAVRLPALVVVSCFWVMTALPATLLDYGRSVGPAVAGAAAPTQPHKRYITGGEARAALWLAAHSGHEDIVATNVVCAPPAYRPGCTHVSFWVAALTGRQLYLGAWAYTEKSLSDYAYQNHPYQTMPSPWPQRLALSLAAVRSPSTGVIDELRRSGVRWIFADRRATSVSPELGRYAALRYADPDVRIYRLADPGPS